MSLDLERTADEAAPAPSGGDDATRSRHEQVLSDMRRKLTRKIVAMAKKGETHEAPGVLEVDVSFFMDPELYAREHQKLFRETPLMACLSTDIAQPGSYQI